MAGLNQGAVRMTQDYKFAFQAAANEHTRRGGRDRLWLRTVAVKRWVAHANLVS